MTSFICKPTKGKSTEAENGFKSLPGARDEDGGDYNGHNESFRGDGTFLKLDYGISHTILFSSFSQFLKFAKTSMKCMLWYIHYTSVNLVFKM